MARGSAQWRHAESVLNLYVGSDVNPDNENIVQSLFGELTVTFPTNSGTDRSVHPVRFSL